MLALPLGINLGVSMEDSLYEQDNSQEFNSSGDSEKLYEGCGLKGDTSLEKANKTTQITTELDNANTEKSKQLGDVQDSSNIIISSAEDTINFINNKKGTKCAEGKDDSTIYEESKKSNVKDITINSEVKNELEQKNQSNINININDVKQDEPKKQQNSVNTETTEQPYTLLPYPRYIRTRMTKGLITHKMSNSLALIWKRDMGKPEIKSKIGPRACLIVDADLTLSKTMELILAPEYSKQYEAIKDIMEILYPEYVKNRNFYIDIFWRKRKEVVIDIWKAFINDFEFQGGKVIVVTAIENQYLTKRHPNDPYEMLIGLRHKQLNDIIDPELRPIKDTFGNKAENGWLGRPGMSPYYYNGILTSGKLDKGSVVETFFAKIGFKPEILFAIDDQSRNLKSCECLSYRYGCPLYTYIYKGAALYQYGINFTFRLACYQLSQLIVNRIWLTDLKAKSALENCSPKEKEWVKNVAEICKNHYIQKQQQNERSKTPKTKLKGK